MYFDFIKLLSGSIILSAALVGTMPAQSQLSPTTSLITKHKNLVASYPSIKNKPPSKTATISIEGEKTTINLKLYQYSNLLTTYFPEKDFLVEPKKYEEGTEVKFIANFGGQKNDNAYINFSFLDGLKTVAQVRNFVTDKNSLIASNKWQIVSKTRNAQYSWAKEKIVFRKGKNILGEIYIGEQKGKAFYVITHFPVEYGDGFAPRADLILRNFEVGG